MDSFDHYQTGQRLNKYDSVVNGPQIVAGVGRNGTQAMRSVATNGGDNRIIKNFSSHATWIVGFAFQADQIGTTTSILRIQDGSTQQMEVKISPSGLFLVSRAGTTLATGSQIITPTLYYHVQFKTTIHNTTGAYELRVNSVTELSATNVDTQNSANATASQIHLGKDALGSGTGWEFDDYWICNGADSGVSGAPNNDFLGDLRIQLRMPSGNGNSSGMVGSDGNSTDNYLLVDDPPPPNSDTDYVVGDSVGDKDTYAMQDLTPTAGTVFGIQVGHWAKKTDAGARSICNVVRSASVEEDSADYSLGTDYDYNFDIREDDPSGNQWTISSVNAMEAGTKVTV
jgi:hypothetical protein